MPPLCNPHLNQVKPAHLSGEARAAPAPCQAQLQVRPGTCQAADPLPPGCCGARPLAGFAIDVVNSCLHVRSAADGTPLSAPTSVTEFFQAGLPVSDSFDPRCER